MKRLSELTDAEIDAEIVEHITSHAQKVQKIIMIVFMHRMTSDDIPRIQDSLNRITDRSDIEWIGHLRRWGYCEIWRTE